MAQGRPVAIVVGVGAGLGAALARRFAEGFAVALVARSDDVTNAVAKEIRTTGGVALHVRCDAAVAAEVAAAYEQIAKELGTPDVLVYNGGRRPFGTLVDTTPEVF